MAWKIDLDKKAAKMLASLDKPVQKRIKSFLKDKFPKLFDPRSIGEPLKGNLGGLWKYRVGDYRLICSIEEEIITVIVLRIDHRKKIYLKQSK